MGPSGLVGLEQQRVKWSSGRGQHVDIAAPHMRTAGDKKSWAGPGNEARIRACEAFRARAAMACL